MSKANVQSKLHELIDAIEEEYGDVEGFEVRLEHPIVGGERQSHTNIKEFILIHLHRTEIEVKIRIWKSNFIGTEVLLELITV